jgi:hypothetical protein
MILDLFDLYLLPVLDLVSEVLQELTLGLLDHTAWHALVHLVDVLLVLLVG